MRFDRAAELLGKFPAVCRQHGFVEASRRAVRRVRNRLNRPLIQQHQSLIVQLQDLQQRHAELELRYQEVSRAQTHLLHELQSLANETRPALWHHSQSIRWLAENHRSTGVENQLEAETPLVSVIMAAWNRQDYIARAIRSVVEQAYTHWELIVVDDGSTDQTREVVRPFTRDARIRLLAKPHRGTASARNEALANSRGSLIAYLDTDNTWFPSALSSYVQGFADHPDCDVVYGAQAWTEHPTDASWIRADAYDFDEFLNLNAGIDLNAFAHRRSVYERLGGFDPGLTRLIDCDLILRYCSRYTPRALPAVVGSYEAGPWKRISNQENLAHNWHIIREKHQPRIPITPRVLYALWHYPQLSESYIAAEIAYMRRRGVHVEVWSEIDPASPFETDLKIHRGTLDAAIESARPDLLQMHWLSTVDRYRDDAARTGLPITVRGHGFEFSTELAASLERDPLVKAIYVFPHLAAQCPAGLSKVRALNVSFDSRRYRPSHEKDTRLVVRAGAALPSKDLGCFLQVARQCPEHRFVLALVACHNQQDFVDKIRNENHELGSPAEVRVNLPPGEIDQLMARAGIYLHTHGTDTTFGMPMTIAESMATGALVLARRCPAFQAYLESAGACYDDAEHAAALVRDTLCWHPDRWRELQIRAINRAYAHFADSMVLPAILHDWVRIASAYRHTARVSRSA